MQSQIPPEEEISTLSKGEVNSGDILVPLRLITSSALLLDKKVRIDEGRFLDFCTFISAFTLHDRVIILPVEYIPDELLNTSLFSYLTDDNLKILRLLTWNLYDFEPEIRDELEVLFGHQFSREEVIKYLDDERFESYYTEEVIKSHNAREKYIDHVIDIIRRKDWNSTIAYAVNKEDEMAFRVRSALYTKISETLNIPFLVDFTRLPIIRRYHARIQKSLRMFIDSTVDEPAQKQLSDARKVIGRWPIPVASPISQFLTRYSTPNSQPGEVLESLRSDFDSVRGQIIQWEGTLRDTEMISPEQALEVLGAVSSKIKSIQNEQSVSDLFFTFAPAIVPSIDPNKVIDLARKGYNLFKWLLDRKQMSYFTTAKDEANKIVGQRDLFRNAFDYGLTNTQAEKFKVLSNHLEKLYEPLESE